MSEIVLYNFELDEGCYRVRLALSLLSLDFQAVAVDVFPGREQTTPPYLALNPSGRLPILKEGDLVLSGTEAILAHLARAHDPSGRWLPVSGPDFAGVMQWLVFSAHDMAAAIEARQTSLFGLPGDLAGLTASARKGLRIMEDHMVHRSFAGQDWFATTQATMADVALFPAFALSRDFGIDHDDFPALRRWARRFRALPGFRTMPGIPDYH